VTWGGIQSTGKNLEAEMERPWTNNETAEKREKTVQEPKKQSVKRQTKNLSKAGGGKKTVPTENN